MSSRKSRKSRTSRRRMGTVGHWLGLFFLEGLAVGVILYLIATRAQNDALPIAPSMLTRELANQPRSSSPPALSIEPRWQGNVPAR